MTISNAVRERPDKSGDSIAAVLALQMLLVRNAARALSRRVALRRAAMDDRRRYQRVSGSWPVRLSNQKPSLVGRTVDIGAYGLCVATAPTVDVRLGNSYRVEAVAQAGTHVRVGPDRLGIQTREQLPLE
jgi:hypothetical protein